MPQACHQASAESWVQLTSLDEVHKAHQNFLKAILTADLRAGLLSLKMPLRLWIKLPKPTLTRR